MITAVHGLDISLALHGKNHFYKGIRRCLAYKKF